MDSKKILNKRKKAKIFIDSASFKYSINNSKAEKLLLHMGCNPFLFYRYPQKVKYEQLKRIPEIKITFDANNEIKEIIYESENVTTTNFFSHKNKDVIEFTKYIFEKDNLKDFEIELMKLLYIVADSSRLDKKITYFLVTDNKTILKNRDYLCSYFVFSEINIVSIDEAIEILSLYLKFQDYYYIRGNNKVNKGLWYDLAFRKYITINNYDDINIGAFAIRMTYILMALDEMGFQYYLGVNNDTHDNMMFYFNYFITLATGIFDALTLRTKSKYNISIGDDYPSKISINKKSGTEFLKKIREFNPDLRRHITNYSNFIKLIYEIREIVVHREMFEHLRMSKNNFLKIDEHICKMLKNFKKEKSREEIINNWGLYEDVRLHLKCLDMYIFSKRAVKKIILFSRRFLELIGYSQQRSDKLPNWLKGSIKVFEEDALCNYL